MGDDQGDVAETIGFEASRGSRGDHTYLFVIAHGSSAMVRLPDHGAVTIGRDSRAELRVDHSSVSRRHARIVVDGGAIQLSDLESRNGTRVNGVRLDRARALVTGDVIAVGEVLLMVHADRAREREPVAATRRIALGDREVLVCHPAMAQAFELLARLARSDLPVLIVGETGVGKENAAFALHHYSDRRDHPFVALNCAALPEMLVESQLFGHDKGAFTGATSARPGLFETASGGTLFLDEIGELAPAVQAKLLRALETKRITRVGETKERAVALRVVAATNRVLENEVAAQRFREDLYFRLGAARVHLRPLRERRCEIPMLFREFVEQAARRLRRAPPEPDPEVIQRLLSYAWPGNVRELKNIVELVMATVEDDRIEPGDLPPQIADAPLRGDAPPPSAAPLIAAPAVAAPPVTGPMRRLADEQEELERQRMTEALARTGGVKTKAAALIGMPIRTFNMKIRQYGL